MKENGLFVVDSPLGKQKPDNIGSPIGVTRIDPVQSYSGIGGLLQEYINNSDLDAWNKIKKKIEIANVPGISIIAVVLARRGILRY